MKRLVLILALGIFTLALTAQNKTTQKPDERFKKGEYKQASLEYEKLAKTAEKLKKAPSYDMAYVYYRLGECYLHLREYVKAELNFAKAQEKSVIEPKFLLYYGDALLANEKPEKALRVYQQYLTENPESLDVSERIRKVQFYISSLESPNGKTNPVIRETKLNATNNQYALAWFRGALLFSSDRAAIKGSKKTALSHFYYTQPIYDSRQDQVVGWNTLREFKELKTSAPDHSFAYDNHTSTYYVMRCLTSKGDKHCNIYTYQTDPNGKLSEPMKQSFFNDTVSMGHPTLSSDGRVMFFSLTKDNKSDLYMVKKIGENTWTDPEKLSVIINTSGDECYPQLYRDSLLFFASDGHLGMGGLDIFYTKIMVDGVGHAISGNSDFGKLVFSAPVNVGMPINSCADDVSMLMKPSGRGGFFISNREVDGKNKSHIYSFAQEPYIFDESGRDLTERFPMNEKTPIASNALKSFHKTDTVFVDRIIEKNAPNRLQDKDAQISKLLKDSDELQHELAAVRKQLKDCESKRTDSVPKQSVKQQPKPQPPKAPKQVAQSTSPKYAPKQVQDSFVSKSRAQVVERLVPRQKASRPVASENILIYRVQVAAATAWMNYYKTYANLLRTMPDLAMEIIYDTDGYYRFVTIPYTTFAEADVVRTKIKEQGYKCFVAGYRGKRRVSINVR